MDDMQLKAVSGLVARCQAALITMADYLAKQNIIDKEALANYFDSSANALHENISPRQIIELSLR
jgi:hypothetical protein